MSIQIPERWRQADRKTDKETKSETKASIRLRNEFILGAWWLSVTCRNEQIHLEN